MMTNADFYRMSDMDISVILVYPRFFTSALTEFKQILTSKNRHIIDEGTVSVSDALALASAPTDVVPSHHIVRSTDPRVWNILRPSIESDSIRVVGVFHAAPKFDLPANMVRLDVGSGLTSKVTPSTVSAISTALHSDGSYPKGSSEDMYFGVMALCYEVLYEPERKMFSKKDIESVYTAHAYRFMSNPPSPLTEQSMRRAVNNFFEDINELSS